MIPDLEKRLRGGPHTYSFLLGMGNELTERRKKPRCKTSPAKKSGKPKPPIAQTPQNRLRGLAPGPITKITRPPRRRRPPSTPSTSSSQQQRVQELLGQHVSNVPTNSPPTFGMPVGGPDTRPPPIPLPQVPIPMGQTWPTTQFFRGGKETGEVPGCYTRSVEHTIISWGLAGLAGGNIEPMPPSRGPGYQTRLELVLAGDTADDDGRVLIQFLAQISDVMEGTDYCIGLSLLRKVEANKGSLDSSSKPSASSSFSDVNQGMVTGMTPPPTTTTYSAGHLDTGQHHAGMNLLSTLSDTLGGGGDMMSMDHLPPPPAPPPSAAPMAGSGWAGSDSYSYGQLLNGPDLTSGTEPFNFDQSFVASDPTWDPTGDCAIRFPYGADDPQWSFH